LEPALDSSAHRPQDAGGHAGIDRGVVPDVPHVFKAKAKKLGRKSWRVGHLRAAGQGPTRSIRSKRRAMFILRTSEIPHADLRAFAQRGVRAPLDRRRAAGRENAAARSAWEYHGEGEPRVLCNFDGSFDQVATIVARKLGARLPQPVALHGGQDREHCSSSRR